MNSKIIQEFKGEINGIEFDDKNIYYSTEYILENLENKFKDSFSNKFVEDLKETISRMYLKYEEFTFAILENDFSRCIEKADKFENIRFSYNGSEWKIEELNEKIKNGEYSLEKENIFKSIIWYENETGQYKGICIQEEVGMINNCFMLDIRYKDKEKIERLVNSKNEILSLGFSEKSFIGREREATLYSEEENNIPLLKDKKELEEYIRNSEMKHHYVYEKEKFNIYTKNNEYEKGIEMITMDKAKNSFFQNSENRSNYVKLAKLNNKIKWKRIESNFAENKKRKNLKNKDKEYER